MATIKRYLSTRTNTGGKSEIYLRVTVARGLQFRLATGLFMQPSRFKDGAITKPRLNTPEAEELRRLEADLISLEQYLINFCSSTPKSELNADYLRASVEAFRNPRAVRQEQQKDVSDIIPAYLEAKKPSTNRCLNYACLRRKLRRFKRYAEICCLDYSTALDGMKATDLEAFRVFLENEHIIFRKYPEIFNDISETNSKYRLPIPRQKGNNAIVAILRQLCAVFNWAIQQGMITENPFAKFIVGSESYGTPYYISLEERDRIAGYDLSATPALEVQRDIFIFHCYIGCRVSDLARMTTANIIDGAIEYIANKTKHDRADVVRVPLHDRALALLQKYQGQLDGRLFPFLSRHRYNDAIKRIFTVCGITRRVTIRNPKTGAEEQRPLNEVASSHIARRTFCGNMYKKVRDPNLVGKLSGHKEGSKAFARYRDIDEDMKRDLINLL